MLSLQGVSRVASIRFLLWNIDENPIEKRIGRLIESLNIDVLALVEPGELLERDQITLDSGETLKRVSDSVSRFALFSRAEDTTFTTLLGDHRWLIMKSTFGSAPDINLVVSHLPSKTNANDHCLTNAAIELNRDILDCEARAGHARTILLGDLNMNPFETGVATNQGFNATSTKHVAQMETRTVQRRKYPLFYNPMWSMFGDRTPGPPGSYYRASGEAISYRWNIYDQVLLRPKLMEALDELRFLDSDGVESLLTVSGIPNRKYASDHLPLFFSLNLDAIRS